MGSLLLNEQLELNVRNYKLISEKTKQRERKQHEKYFLFYILIHVHVLHYQDTRTFSSTLDIFSLDVSSVDFLSRGLCVTCVCVCVCDL